MSEIIAATAFAQIVGLICNFKQERRDRTEDEYNEFQEWLSSKRHIEIQDLLSHNIGLSNSVRELVSESSESLTEKMVVVEAALLQVSSKIDGLSKVAQYFEHEQELSDQAVSILVAVVQGGGGACTMLFSPMAPTGKYLVVDHSNETIELNEIYFVEGDLDALIKFGYLLPPKQVGANDQKYSITRPAIKFVENLIKK